MIVLVLMAVALVAGRFPGFVAPRNLASVFTDTAPLIILASRKRFWSKPSVNGMGKAMQVGERHRHAGVEKQAHEGEKVHV